MIELDERVRHELDILVPLPDESERWDDVLQRAGERAFPRRRLVVLAFAAATLATLALSPIGGALAREFGDFSAWLTGNPGEPASAEEQRAFEEANARTWGSFPDGPKLRKLIETEVAGGSFELFGFRTGDSLCLRLTAEGFRPGGPATSCAPLRELRSADAPAVVVLVDWSFGRRDVPPNEDGFVPPQALASFGVVADGIERVEIETSDGDPLRALVAHNVFLAIAEDPPLPPHAQGLVAESAQGERIEVPIAQSPFGNTFPAATPGVAPGPTEVERELEGGTIGWLQRREPRGQSLAEAGFADWRFPFTRRSDVRFARVVAPDPNGLARVALGLVDVERDPRWVLPRPAGEQLCSILHLLPSAQLGTCGTIRGFFAHRPLTFSLSGGPGGSQYTVLHGLASDDVARLEVFLATGERVAVPLADNAYVLEVARTKFPIRLVAYDDAGRIVAIQTFEHDPLARPGPQPVPGEMRAVKRVVAPNGQVATLRMGPSTEGTVCWEVRRRGAGDTGGCHQKEHTGPPLGLNQSAAGILFGTPSPEVATVELRFRNGERVEVELVGGVVLHGLTAQQLESGGMELAIGYDEDGDEVGRQTRP